MEYARRMLRHWRWCLVIVALLTVYPLLWERRRDGPLDGPDVPRAAQRAEALVESDPRSAESLVSATLQQAPARFHPRLLDVRARARLRLLLIGAQPAPSRVDVAADIEASGALDAGRMRMDLAELSAIAGESPAQIHARLRSEIASAPTALQAIEGLRGVPSLIRARQLFLAGRHREAIAAARDSGEAGLWFEAESKRLMSDGDAEESGTVLARGVSPLAPLGHLVIGRILLARSDPAGWLHVVEAVPLLRSGWIVVHAGIEVPVLKQELREAVKRSDEPEWRRGGAVVLARWHDTFPDDAGALADAAEAAVQSASVLEARDRTQEAREMRCTAAELFSRLAKLGDAWALRRCAQEWLAAGNAIKAADIFHMLPERDAAYWEGIALGRAGLVQRALDRLDDYIAAVPAGDPLVPSALVERARLKSTIGDPATLTELNRFFEWPALADAPTSEAWRRALFLKARIHLRHDDRPQARAALEEFIQRYAPPDRGAPRNEVAFARAQLAVLVMSEGKFLLARELLVAAHADLDGGAEPSDVETVEMTVLIMGDAYLGLGLARDAQVLYSEASLRIRQPAWKIVALCGHARASIRLNEPEVARKDFERARAIYQERRAEAGSIAFLSLENLRRELP